jgi:hypothetical protein
MSWLRLCGGRIAHSECSLATSVCDAATHDDGGGDDDDGDDDKVTTAASCDKDRKKKAREEKEKEVNEAAESASPTATYFDNGASSFCIEVKSVGREKGASCPPNTLSQEALSKEESTPRPGSAVATAGHWVWAASTPRPSPPPPDGATPPRPPPTREDPLHLPPPPLPPCPAPPRRRRRRPRAEAVASTGQTCPAAEATAPTDSCGAAKVSLWPRRRRFEDGPASDQ